MAIVRKLFSWILPMQVKQVEGKISPVLEITFENGKKILNAGEVNYSYGALHDVFRVALQKAKIIEQPPSNVLILGFGGGSIATIIVEEFGQNPEMIGIEADPVVIHLAKKEFNCDRFLKLEIENTTAEKFIAQNKIEFDLIAIDVFVEANVPETCKTEHFLKQVNASLTKNGRAVFNEMPDKLSGKDFESRFRKCFDRTEIHELFFGGSPNKILIGYKKEN